MQLYRIKALALLPIMAMASVASAESPKDGGQQEINFSVAGVQVGSSLDEFLKRIPAAFEGRLSNSLPMRDDHLVTLDNGTQNPPIAFFRFKNRVVNGIEIEYSPESIREVSMVVPMLERLQERFGKYSKTWENILDGGTTVYAWESPTRFVSFAIFDDGRARLFIRKHPGDVLWPIPLPKTSILGIDDVQTAKREASEPVDARETSASSVLNSNSTPRSP